MLNLKIINELNDKQREAALHKDGAMYVIAGAGTGKTKTLTARIVALIESGVPANSILAMTFTNKATKEMRERLEQEIGFVSRQTQINTFHSFAAKFLREQAYKIGSGFDTNFAILDDDDSSKVLKEVIKESTAITVDHFTEMAYGQDTGVREELDGLNFKTVKSEISKFKSLEKSTMGLTEHETFFFNKTHEIYQKRLALSNVMDFDDLMVFLYDVLRLNKDVANYYQNLFNYILVDEFQDTNKIQFEIIKLLSNSRGNVFVVGDPDQSIYAFRGARYENNNLFFKEFGAKKVVLDKNYRSTNNILRAANKLIRNNHDETGQKNLSSDLGDGPDIELESFFTSDGEVDYVMRKINDYIIDGISPSEIAILYRNNFLSRGFEQQLVREGFAYTIYGGLSFFERMEVKDIVAYVRVIMDPKMLVYIKRIINVPKRKIGLVTVGKIEKEVLKTGKNFFECYKDVKLSKSTTNSITEFDNNITFLRGFLQDEENGPTEFFERLIELTKYFEYLDESYESEEASERKMNVEELVTVFVKGFNYYEGSNMEKMNQVLDEISLMTDRDKNDSKEEEIILSTYHQVKGLEFKVVFMVAMENSIFPNLTRLEKPEDLEEERRIAYVGITRAKKHLHMSHSNERYIYGRATYAHPSQFIYESGIGFNY